MAGTVKLGTKLEIAYFDQTREVLDMDKTAEENVGQGKTMITVNGKSKHVIGYLQDFLFTPEQARSSIRFFSGGQRNRLLLAKLFARPANMLVMDEPTNDLDTESLELLEDRLVDYEGTVLIVSHDRSFLNNVVTSTVVFEKTGVKEYVGGYDDWLRQRKADLNKANKENAAKPTASSNSKADKSSSGGGQGVAVAKKLSFKERQDLEKLPSQIESYEAEQRTIHAEMQKPEYFKSSQNKLAKDQSRLSQLNELLVAAYARWEDLLARDQQNN
jgi:ATP-binding cassette subfamily F protein uup